MKNIIGMMIDQLGRVLGQTGSIKQMEIISIYAPINPNPVGPTIFERIAKLILDPLFLLGFLFVSFLIGLIVYIVRIIKRERKK